MKINPFVLIFTIIILSLWISMGPKTAFDVSFIISLLVGIYIITTNLWNKPIRRVVDLRDYGVLASQIFLTFILSIFVDSSLFIIFSLLLAFCFVWLNWLKKYIMSDRKKILASQKKHRDTRTHTIS